LDTIAEKDICLRSPLTEIPDGDLLTRNHTFRRTQGIFQPEIVTKSSSVTIGNEKKRTEKKKTNTTIFETMRYVFQLLQKADTMVPIDGIELANNFGMSVTGLIG